MPCALSLEEYIDITKIKKNKTEPIASALFKGCHTSKTHYIFTVTSKFPFFFKLPKIFVQKLKSSLILDGVNLIVGDLLLT